MTLLRWREHPAARAEVRDAAVWYDTEEAGLGTRFADAVEDGVTFIRTWPTVAPLFRDDARVPLRRKALDTFPYGIIYIIRGDEVIVIAYAHERRRPGYWRRRLSAL